MTEWPLAPLVAWIAGDEKEGYTLAGLVADLFPDPIDGAAATHGVEKITAYLRQMQRYTWHEGELDEPPEELAAAADLAALEIFARKYAIQIRLCLLEPASPSQIADDLVILADVLDQAVAEPTAAFIIEMIEKAKLPPFVVHELFQRVAMAEGGKIKPASFNRLLQVMQPRMKLAWRAASDARAFVQHLDAALTCLRECQGVGAD